MSNNARFLIQHFSHFAANKPAVSDGVEWLEPYIEFPDSKRVFKEFVEKYYSDNNKRYLILGINPGRFGSGITNVAFTDPIKLKTRLGIDNDFNQRAELSADFVYQVIDSYGGEEQFYEQFFVNSVCPYGFIKDRKNYNYYDSKTLTKEVEDYVTDHLFALRNHFHCREIVFCLGTGKNYAFLQKWNERHHGFDKIVPLAHPRYVMQYKRRFVDDYIQEYLQALGIGD